MIDDQPTPAGGAGCGLLGCLGGLILGLTASALVVLVSALVTAVGGSVPAVTPPAAPALKISLTEDFLNRFVEQPPTGSLQIDVQPGNQVQVNANTTADVLGLPVPVQVAGLFQIRATPQTLRVELLDTRVLGLDVNLSGIFDSDTAQINQSLDTMMQDISQTLGTSLELTGLSTTDTTIELEMREAR